MLSLVEILLLLLYPLGISHLPQPTLVSINGDEKRQLCNWITEIVV
jgi:hypothetical protein